MISPGLIYFQVYQSSIIGVISGLSIQYYLIKNTIDTFHILICPISLLDLYLKEYTIMIYKTNHNTVKKLNSILQLFYII